MQRSLETSRELSLEERRELIENAIVQYKLNRGIGTAREKLSPEKQSQVNTVHGFMDSAKTAAELTTKVIGFSATLPSTYSSDGGLKGMIKTACTQTAEQVQAAKEQEKSKKEEAARRMLRSMLVRREKTPDETLKFWNDSYFNDTKKYMVSVRVDLKFLGFVAVMLGANYSGFNHRLACDNSEKLVENNVLNTKIAMLKIAYLFYMQCRDRQYIEDVLSKQKITIEQTYQEEVNHVTKGFDLAYEFIGKGKLRAESKSKEGDILKSLCEKSFAITTEACSVKIAAFDKEKNDALEVLTALEKECKRVLSENHILDAAAITAYIEGEERPSSLMQYTLCLITPEARRKPEKLKLYVEAAGKEALQYTVVTPSHNQETGIIKVEDLKELKDKISDPLDISLLTPLLSTILEVTSKRGHTFATLSPKAHELFSKYEDMAKAVKSQSLPKKFPTAVVSDFVIRTLENMYEDDLSKKEKHDVYVKLNGADEVVTKSVFDKWKRPVYSEDKTYLSNIRDRVQHACHFYVSHALKTFARRFIDENSNLECRDLESKAKAIRAEYLRLKAKVEQNEASIQAHDYQSHMDAIFNEYKAFAQNVIKENTEFKKYKDVDLINQIDNSQIGKMSPLLTGDEKIGNLVDFAAQQYVSASTQTEKENIFKLLEMLFTRGALLSRPSELYKENKRDFVSFKVSARIMFYSLRMLLSTNSSAMHVWTLIKLSLVNTPIGSEVQGLLKNKLIEYCDDSLKSVSRWNAPTIDEISRMDKVYEVMSAIQYAYVNCDDSDLLNKMMLLKDDALDNRSQGSLRETVREIERKVEGNQLFCFFSPATTPFRLGMFNRASALPVAISDNALSVERNCLP